MEIRVKTAGLLGQYLPPGSARNRAELSVKDGATPADVMAQLGLPPEDLYLVSHNGSVVPTDKRDQVELKEGDQLAIMPPLKGG